MLVSIPNHNNVFSKISIKDEWSLFNVDILLVYNTKNSVYPLLHNSNIVVPSLNPDEGPGFSGKSWSESFSSNAIHQEIYWWVCHQKEMGNGYRTHYPRGWISSHIALLTLNDFFNHYRIVNVENDTQGVTNYKNNDDTKQNWCEIGTATITWKKRRTCVRSYKWVDKILSSASIGCPLTHLKITFVPWFYWGWFGSLKG